MREKLILILFMILFVTPVSAQDNEELGQLYELDQAARKAGDIDWDVLSREDSERRKKVLEMFAAGSIRTARDYFNAAMIFQHGETAEDIRIAHSFATLASALDSELGLAKWLKASSWDRILLRFEQPQWYGTQYIKLDAGGLELYEVAPDIISDEQRMAWGIPTLEEARNRFNKSSSE